VDIIPLLLTICNPVSLSLRQCLHQTYRSTLGKRVVNLWFCLSQCRSYRWYWKRFLAWPGVCYHCLAPAECRYCYANCTCFKNILML